MAHYSIIVVNFDGQHVLRECVESVLRFTQPNLLSEVIVADNASGDEVVEEVERLSPKVRLLRLERNLGYGAAVNAAAKESKADSIVALNNDAMVKDGWLEELDRALEARDGRALVFPLLVEGYASSVVNSAGVFLTPIGTTGALFKGTLVADLPRNLDASAPTGGCFAMRKSAFDEVGGLDEGLFMYCEDLDLGWRAFRSGYESVLVPTSRVDHTTPIRRTHRYYQWNLRNRIIVIRKNAIGLQRLSLLPLSFMSGVVSAGLLSATRGLNFRTLVGAVFEGVSWETPRSSLSDPPVRFPLLPLRQLFTQTLLQLKGHVGPRALSPLEASYENTPN